MQWFPSIKGFENLEKIEIDMNIRQVSRNTVEDLSFQNMIQNFLNNPMTKTKELKFAAVNFLFQDDFLIHLTEIFPNLQTFNAEKLGDVDHLPPAGVIASLNETNISGEHSYWKFENLLQVLKSLGSVKNLILPSMEIVLNDEHYHGIRETGRVFNEALQIIKNNFPLPLGDLKITDEKYGYVILKEKMKKPKLFNQKLVNGRPVSDTSHCEETKKIFLKLKPKKRKGKTSNEEDEIVLSEGLIKSLYKEFFEGKAKYNY